MTALLALHEGLISQKSALARNGRTPPSPVHPWRYCALPCRPRSGYQQPNRQPCRLCIVTILSAREISSRSFSTAQRKSYRGHPGLGGCRWRSYLLAEEALRGARQRLRFHVQALLCSVQPPIKPSPIHYSSGDAGIYQSTHHSQSRRSSWFSGSLTGTVRSCISAYRPMPVPLGP